jgi:hypothetical protein
MRWAAREVVFVVAAAWLLSLPACGSEFSGVSDGVGGTVDAGSAGSSASGGSAGSSSAGGKSGGGAGAGQGAGSGSGGSDPNPGGGKGGGNSGSAGEAGEPPMETGGMGGSDNTPECEVELLTKGGFDVLDSGWSQMAEPERALIWHQSSDMLMDLGHAPVSPEYAVVLGAADGDYSSLSQEVTVPADATALVVSFYMHVHSDEDDAQVYDTLTISLTSGNDDPIPVATYDNFDTNDDWAPVSFLLEATPYRGKTLNFLVLSDADDGVDTTFLLDSFSLTAKLCDP